MTDQELVEFWKNEYLNQAHEIAELKQEIEHYVILVQKLEGEKEIAKDSGLEDRIKAIEIKFFDLSREFFPALERRFSNLESESMSNRRLGPRPRPEPIVS